MTLQAQADPVAKSPVKVAAPADNTHLSMQQIVAIQRQRARAGREPIPGLVPYWDGQAIKLPMRNLLDGPTPDLNAKVKTAQGLQKVDPKAYQRYAQLFPRPVAPASPGAYASAKPTIPKWVRYPLEFQLAGIGLGTRAVDKDRFNRIDRYGLFALHGNPHCRRALRRRRRRTNSGRHFVAAQRHQPGKRWYCWRRWCCCWRRCWR